MDETPAIDSGTHLYPLPTRYLGPVLAESGSPDPVIKQTTKTAVSWRRFARELPNSYIVAETVESSDQRRRVLANLAALLSHRDRHVLPDQ